MQSLEYLLYLAENLESSIDYAEYMSDNLKQSTSYSEYIAGCVSSKGPIGISGSSGECGPSGISGSSGSCSIYNSTSANTYTNKLPILDIYDILPYRYDEKRKSISTDKRLSSIIDKYANIHQIYE